MIRFITLAGLFYIAVPVLTGQQRVGINTPTPDRTLHVNGTGDQYLRIRSASLLSTSGFELVRGANSLTSTDWRIINDSGSLKIQYGDNNFATSGSDAMRFTANGKTGIGATVPVSVLHIDGGTQLHDNGGGYLRLNSTAATYLVFDNNGISAKSNNNTSDLYLQSNGGTTFFNQSGGNTYMVQGGGSVGIGTSGQNARLNIADNDFQLYLRNEGAGGINDWYIGASNNTWIAGDDQLLFSPTSSSADAVLRLKSVTENDGNNAPVMIHTNTDQTILIDGNEIDTRGATLHFNHNSQNNTYINPSGGLVGIGTDNPTGALHIRAFSGENILALQRNEWIWTINSQIGGNENMSFTGQGYMAAQIHGVNGQWMTYSDARRKENITPMRNVLQDLMTLPVFSYSFIHDPLHTRSIGVMAQDLMPKFPELVKEIDDQYGVAYAQLAILALKAVQEQQEHLAELRNKLAQAKKKVTGVPESLSQK